MGHGTVADEIKGRAAQFARRARRRDPLDRGGGRALPLLPRRLDAVHGPGDLDGGPGRARLGHRARVRRVHAVPRRPRLHRALDRAHAPLAGPLPGLARRSTGRRGRSSTGSSRAASTRTCGARPRRRSPRARRSAGSRSAARSARTRRRCSRSSSGRSRSCRRTSRATCSGSARSTTSCAASSSASTPSTARCRPGSAATAWRSCPTRTSAGASTSPRRAGARPTSRCSTAARARPAPRGYSRAYLHYLFKAHASRPRMRLLTIHNLAYVQRLMAELRAAIDAGRLARGRGRRARRRRAVGAVSFKASRPRLERPRRDLRRADGARDRVAIERMPGATSTAGARSPTSARTRPLAAAAVGPSARDRSSTSRSATPRPLGVARAVSGPATVRRPLCARPPARVRRVPWGAAARRRRSDHAADRGRRRARSRSA